MLENRWMQAKIKFQTANWMPVNQTKNWMQPNKVKISFSSNNLSGAINQVDLIGQEAHKKTNRWKVDKHQGLKAHPKISQSRVGKPQDYRVQSKTNLWRADKVLTAQESPQPRLMHLAQSAPSLIKQTSLSSQEKERQLLIRMQMSTLPKMTGLRATINLLLGKKTLRLRNFRRLLIST